MAYGNNAKMPAGVKSSDERSERHEREINGVAQGMQDKTGADKQFNTGRSEGVCYTHDRKSHQ